MKHAWVTYLQSESKVER